jgi:hypothetical protein
MISFKLVSITVFVIRQFLVTSWHFTVFRDHQPCDGFDVTVICDSCSKVCDKAKYVYKFTNHKNILPKVISPNDHFA